MADRLLNGKRVLLGVTGGIAAYKAADLCSKLAQAGAEVDVILTDAAAKFRRTAHLCRAERPARARGPVGVAGRRSHPARDDGGRG